MKKIIVVLLILLCPTINAFSQIQIYDSWEGNLNVSRYTSNDVYPRGVISSPNNTIVLVQPNMNHKWLRFSSETKLRYCDPVTGDTNYLRIKSLKNLDGANVKYWEKYYLSSGTCLLLEFGSIPSSVTQFDVVDQYDWRGYKFYGIRLWPQNRTIPIRIIHTELELTQLLQSETDGRIGLYEKMDDSDNIVESIVVVSKDKQLFALFNGDTLSSPCWKYGEIVASLRPTSAPNVCKTDWHAIGKYDNWYVRCFAKLYADSHLVVPKIKKSAVVSFEGSLMKVIIGEKEYVYVKMDQGSDSNNNSRASDNAERWSGTGFAIGANYIVTNYHVVNGAKNIFIKGVNNDFEDGVKAQVLAVDKNVDLAILSISTSSNTLLQPSYGISTKMADVGEDVFVLGYPLTQALGDELKLTNGIISSRTGFQGNVSTYQMSAPVQPGNSGGPMFDSKGNVIGIVVAGVPGAENVGYAIKTSYLKILIESMGLDYTLPTNNTISNLTLPEKIKKIKSNVFFIECSK